MTLSKAQKWVAIIVGIIGIMGGLGAFIKTYLGIDDIKANIGKTNTKVDTLIIKVDRLERATTKRNQNEDIRNDIGSNGSSDVQWVF